MAVKKRMKITKVVCTDDTGVDHVFEASGSLTIREVNNGDMGKNFKSWLRAEVIVDVKGGNNE